MTDFATGPVRTLVAGSTFGGFYLAALTGDPRFEPVGLLARGSERSVACAARHVVPLYTDVDAVPDGVDLACVVVRSGAMGGAGGELVAALLRRGVPVVQEQPVHHDDVAAALRTARRHGVSYQVGDLYPQLPEVRRFVGAAHRLRTDLAVEYVDAACAVQVAYPLVEILAAALGGLRPWRVDPEPSAAGPFRVLTGTVAGAPLILRVHHELDPDDPDNHLPLLHRVTIGTAAGGLSLIDDHGPVIWSPRLHVPDGVRNAFDFDGPDARHLAEPSGTVLGPARPESYRASLQQVWPRAIAADLADALRRNGGTERAQRTLAACRAWRDLTTALGYPALRAAQRHTPIPRQALDALGAERGAV